VPEILRAVTVYARPVADKEATINRGVWWNVDDIMRRRERWLPFTRSRRKSWCTIQNSATSPSRQVVFPYRDRTILVKDIIPAALSMAERNMSGCGLGAIRAYYRYHNPKIIPHSTTKPPILPPTIAPSFLPDPPEPGDAVGPGMTDVTVVGCIDTDPLGSVVL
jgi:hypothetical protein